LIAQQFYRQRPDRAAALVLCDTAAKIGTDESWDQRIAQVERGGVEEVADSVLKGWFTADSVFGDPPSSPASARC
jgi:3-oxoadipate enol-lactonase